jgi:hypothetical protein
MTGPLRQESSDGDTRVVPRSRRMTLAPLHPTERSEHRSATAQRGLSP